jgi:hypothetical protein
MMTEADKLRAFIVVKEQQIRDLESKYGTGVRPSWVGEDITRYWLYARDAKDKLATMEASNEPDNSNH